MTTVVPIAKLISSQNCWHHSATLLVQKHWSIAQMTRKNCWLIEKLIFNSENSRQYEILWSKMRLTFRLWCESFHLKIIMEIYQFGKRIFFPAISLVLNPASDYASFSMHFIQHKDRKCLLRVLQSATFLRTWRYSPKRISMVQENTRPSKRHSALLSSLNSKCVFLKSMRPVPENSRKKASHFTFFQLWKIRKYDFWKLK